MGDGRGSVGGQGQGGSRRRLGVDGDVVFAGVAESPGGGFCGVLVVRVAVVGIAVAGRGSCALLLMSQGFLVRHRNLCRGSRNPSRSRRGNQDPSHGWIPLLLLV